MALTVFYFMNVENLIYKELSAAFLDAIEDNWSETGPVDKIQNKCSVHFIDIAFKYN